MPHRNAHRAPLLALFIILTCANAAGAGTEFHRWGLGWGDWTPPVYAGVSRGPALRWRTVDGWALTLGAGLDTDNDEQAQAGRNFYSEYEEFNRAERLARTVVLEFSRHYPLHERLALGPALRCGHGYQRDERRYESLVVYDDPFDWDRDTQTERSRLEAYWVGLGLRPRVQIHSRVSAEFGLFLDYWRSHDRDESASRDEDFDGEVTRSGGVSSHAGDGWAVSFASPSLSMSLLLFFYF